MSSVAVVSAAAIAATVGPANSACSDSSADSSDRSRSTSRVASSECPPSAKKSSCAPIWATPSNSANNPATAASVASRGATNWVAA